MSPEGALPNLLVIGGMKCGTSSLHHYLNLHPDIQMSRPKELNFFIEEADRHYIARPNWEQGVSWYRDHFSRAPSVRGESSPSYTAYPHVRGVPERAASIVPDAKLIYLVRDPIERLVSQYLQRFGARKESRSLNSMLDEIIDRRGSGLGYISRSRYHLQSQQWLAHYPRERLLFVAREDLLAHRLATLRRIFQFLGVDDSFVSPRFTTIYRQRSSDKRAPNPLLNTIERPLARATRALPRTRRRPVRERVRSAVSRPLQRPTISNRHRRQLEELLRDDVARLRDLAGQNFESWSL